MATLTTQVGTGAAGEPCGHGHTACQTLRERGRETERERDREAEREREGEREQERKGERLGDRRGR